MKRFIAIFMTLCLVLGMSSVSVWADEVNEWKTETPMPTELQFFGSCVVGDEIYLFGGRDSRKVEIYDTKNQTWKIGTPMLIEANKCKAAAIGSKIYVMCTLGSNDSSTCMQIYDTSTKKWTKISQPDIPYVNTGFALTAIGEKIYVVNFNNNAFRPETSVSIYDTVSGKWTNGKSGGLKLRSDFMACAGGNNIYVIGGQSNNLLEVYDTTTDTWKELGTLPARTYGAAAVMVENYLYLIGGNNPSAVNIYNEKTNSWSKGIPLKTPRSRLESVVVDGKIYAIGGIGNGTGDLKIVESIQAGRTYGDLAAKLSVLLNVGENVQLSTSFDIENNKNFTWSSTNEAVATVDVNGKVTAVAEGTTDIYAQNADGTFKEYIPVKVVKGIADELRLAVHLKTGEKAKLYLADDASKVIWSSMDESIATVSADGQVTGVKKGLAIVKAELDGQTYQIYVRVNG